MKQFFLVFFLGTTLTISLAQDQTVGVFANDPDAFNGYTLLFPNVSQNTWLLDNCGHVINEWETNHFPGLSAYLLEDGSLLRTARIGSTFVAGGTGGRIERYNWEGSLVWSYEHSTLDYHQHHDIEYLPNGNILIIAWEYHTADDAIAYGRDPQEINSNGIWSEQIVEIEPINFDSANIVWEWHLWDHLVQDFDPTKPNYGVVSDHPELMDLNYGGAEVDWIHFNSIDYNPELDQIILSSRHLSEVWIIDHSTTSDEAATHQGGNSGMGGDILYRFGNPEVYQRGSFDDRVLFGQHDAQWIPAGLPDEGKIMVFNNGQGRPLGNFSTIDVWEAPWDADGNYFLEEGEAFGPENLSWSYIASPAAAFYSANISGAQRLPNGNTLICEGRDGRLFEVTPDYDIVWEYISPVVNQGIVTQGNNVNNNNIFRTYRYPVDYPAFEGRDLTPGEPLELQPVDYGCQIWEEEPTSINAPYAPDELKVLGNPFAEELLVENPTGQQMRFTLLDLTGKTVSSGTNYGNPISINTRNINPGFYFLTIEQVDRTNTKTFKVLKN